MHKIKSSLLSLLMLSCSLMAFSQGSRMTLSEAWEWYNKTPWYCGLNYIPSNAINYTEMWDRTSFSPSVIDSELQLMEDLGMNCVRVVLQYAVYADSPSHFIKNFKKFLNICGKHGIQVMPIFFDDCTFGANTDPRAGVQPEPLEGWYAWAWSPSPGYSMVVDERTHHHLEKYVKDVMTHFRDDPRIMAWDLYNEPTNTSMPERSWPLLRKVFKWAREVTTSQPITSGIWNGNQELEAFLAENSDIITFHCYANPEQTHEAMERMLAYGRPVVCTEWLNRPRHSTIAEIMPFFKKNHVGSMFWGLVNGKTQTHLPWGHRPEHGEYTGVWQHDIFRNDHTPYDSNEIDIIKGLTNEYMISEKQH